MKVKVKFFAMLRERAGTGEAMIDIEEGATIGDLWDALKKNYPKLAPVNMRLLYAVNRNYVKADHALLENDEVAFIPPVSGG
jgi:molybdopterin synthase catalytic subunit